MPILTQTFPGAPGGMNTARPQQELDDTEARYIQDGLVDYPGIVRRRGPVQGVPNVAALAKPASGIVLARTPAGADRVAVLNGDGSNGYFSALSDDKASKVDIAWPHPLPTNPAGGASSAYRIVDSKPAVSGGTIVGVSASYEVGAQQGLAFWRGGNKADYNSTVSVSRGSKSVTASAGLLANVAPGMFLFANTDDPYTNAYVGVVVSVNTDTTLTLEKPSPYAITSKSATFKSLRGFAAQVTKGRITCATNATDVNGGDTKFKSQKLDTGSWNLYRASDMTWIGKVSSVASETNLTLAANAAVAMADDEYVALRADADYGIPLTSSDVGFLNAPYAQRQFYANLGTSVDTASYLYFSDINNPEAVDLSEADGDFIPVASSYSVNESMRAIMPAYNALVVLKESEAFALFGTTPSQFELRKIEDDGALSGMSVQPYGGGVIWAGRDGIHYYDGVQVENLTQPKLGDVWKNSVRSFDPTKYRMWSMVVRDHYWLFIERLDPTIAVIKGNVSSTPNNWAVGINMTTRAITLATNLHLRGAITLPASSGHHVWYVVNDATKGIICDTADLYDAEGVDAIACDGGTAGPDFYFESKKFDAGDALRLKRFKLLLMHYLVQGGDILVDSVLGLNSVGEQLTDNFPASVYTWDTLRAAITTWDALKLEFPTWSDVIQAVFVPGKVKFQVKSQHMSFRLYQSTAAITRLRIGPYQIGFKIERAGRS